MHLSAALVPEPGLVYHGGVFYRKMVGVVIEGRELHPVGTSLRTAGVGTEYRTTVADHMDRVAELRAVDGEAVVLDQEPNIVRRLQVESKLVALSLRQPLQTFVAESVRPGASRSVAETSLDVFPRLFESLGGSVVELCEDRMIF